MPDEWSSLSKRSKKNQKMTPEQMEAAKLELERLNNLMKWRPTVIGPPDKSIFTKRKDLHQMKEVKKRYPRKNLTPGQEKFYKRNKDNKKLWKNLKD